MFREELIRLLTSQVKVHETASEVLWLYSISIMPEILKIATRGILRAMAMQMEALKVHLIVQGLV